MTDPTSASRQGRYRIRQQQAGRTEMRVWVTEPERERLRTVLAAIRAGTEPRTKGGLIGLRITFRRDPVQTVQDALRRSGMIWDGRTQRWSGTVADLAGLLKVAEIAHHAGGTVAVT